MVRFIGRKEELRGLQDLLKKESASLVVLRGRRRIGKSRLAEEFSKQFPNSYMFTGLPPSKVPNAIAERAEFRRQMEKLGIPTYNSDDWADLFLLIAKKCKSGRVLVVFDEITWMGSKDPDFLGKLKIAWDLYFKKNPKLILIISGSNSTWIEKNILSSTGFLGRTSYQLLLEELPLRDCNEFWEKKGRTVSSYEKFKVLGVTGGVPRYLEEVLPDKTAEENIMRLAFTPGGILFTEFEQIFSDLFNGRHERYRTIVNCLINGSANTQELTRKIGRVKGGDISEALKDLEETGFLSRDYSWHIKDGVLSKISRYRIKDNYIRFYLKYIENRKSLIKKGTFKSLPPAWLSIMGLQFENLVLNNLPSLLKLLHIPEHEIIAAGPFLQTQAKGRAKCQIDLLIQTKFNQLYICEIKFSKNEVGREVIKEVERKIEVLKYPKKFSCRPVLIHVNGISESVWNEEFFAHVIDFATLLQ